MSIPFNPALRGALGRWAIPALVACLALPVACSKDKKEDASAEKADTVASAKKPTAEKPEKKDKPKVPLEVPVIEDFEERAERRISASNLESELDKLEEEMNPTKTASVKDAPKEGKEAPKEAPKKTPAALAPAAPAPAAPK